tara:strand:- start:104 stop:478 length:375 start_codon:yes stop_codon:yes gene_type:complete
MNYYLSAMQNYAEFNGRSRRKEFWMFTLIYTVILIVAMILDSLFGSYYYIGDVEIIGYLELITSIIHIVPSIAVTIRRLHDINKTGWFFCVILIPLAGIIWYLVMMCTNGTNGENEYGTDPKIS